MHALAVNGLDLFGNGRLRDLSRWPLFVPAPPGARLSSFDAATTWTLVAGGDVMLDRSIYQRTVRQGKGADYPRDGGTAAITGRRCLLGGRPAAADGPADRPRGAVRALFRDADLAPVNLEDRPRMRFAGTRMDSRSRSIRRCSRACPTRASTSSRSATTTSETPDRVESSKRSVTSTSWGSPTSAPAGTRRQPGTPAWFDVAGQRVALLGYDAIRPAYNAHVAAGGQRWSHERRLPRRHRRGARATGADVVVVLPHWGIEYTSAASSGQQGHAR